LGIDIPDDVVQKPQRPQHEQRGRDANYQKRPVVQPHILHPPRMMVLPMPPPHGFVAPFRWGTAGRIVASRVKDQQFILKK
jgi:hypothetical protein